MSKTLALDTHDEIDTAEDIALSKLADLRDSEKQKTHTHEEVWAE